MIPPISVIIPAFNEEKYLGRAIRSLLNQTLDRSLYEIIVVNDNSVDRTDYAMELFAEEIIALTNKEQLGLPGSLNKAIHKARGQYIVRVDADDYVSKDYLYILQLYLEENREFGAVACDYLMVDNEENVIVRKNCEKDPIGCGIMFRTDHLISIGMYDEEFLMHEDRDMRIRFSQQHSIVRVPLPMYRYRQHEANMTKQKDQWNHYEELLVEKHNQAE